MERVKILMYILLANVFILGCSSNENATSNPEALHSDPKVPSVTLQVGQKVQYFRDFDLFGFEGIGKFELGNKVTFPFLALISDSVGLRRMILHQSEKSQKEKVVQKIAGSWVLKTPIQDGAYNYVSYTIPNHDSIVVYDFCETSTASVEQGGRVIEEIVVYGHAGFKKEYYKSFELLSPDELKLRYDDLPIAAKILSEEKVRSTYGKYNRIGDHIMVVETEAELRNGRIYESSDTIMHTAQSFFWYWADNH